MFVGVAGGPVALSKSVGAGGFLLVALVVVAVEGVLSMSMVVVEAATVSLLRSMLGGRACFG